MHTRITFDIPFGEASRLVECLALNDPELLNSIKRLQVETIEDKPNELKEFIKLVKKERFKSSEDKGLPECNQKETDLPLAP